MVYYFGYNDLYIKYIYCGRCFIGLFKINTSAIYYICVTLLVLAVHTRIATLLSYFGQFLQYLYKLSKRISYIIVKLYLRVIITYIHTKFRIYNII